MRFKLTKLIGFPYCLDVVSGCQPLKSLQCVIFLITCLKNFFLVLLHLMVNHKETKKSPSICVGIEMQYLGDITICG